MMDESFKTMQKSIQTALDEISSPRSSLEVKSQALKTLEHHLALVCISQEEDLDQFIALQYTFECNIPSRLITFIGMSTPKLEVSTSKGTLDIEQEVETLRLISQLSISLSVIQGLAMIHTASKTYLGRGPALEVLLDLLLTSRHVMPSSSDSKSSRSPSGKSTSHLTSIILDTLLCILVDSSPSLREFEQASGVQAVVKILKRAGTPREVRMKCLEFLYFYLLDETASSHFDHVSPPSATPTSQLTPPATAPATPIRPQKPYLNSTPLLPSSRYGSSTYSFSSSSGSSSASRSTSGSSVNSISSTSSNTSSVTTTSARSTSPERMLNKDPRTPPNSPPMPRRFPLQGQPKALMMLKKEVDYVPQSPKKTQFSRPASDQMSRHMRGKSLSDLQSRQTSSESAPKRVQQTLSERSLENLIGNAKNPKLFSGEKQKTTEEKKEILGTMLGNVDALVEGVRKAGIWGLG